MCLLPLSFWGCATPYTPAEQRKAVQQAKEQGFQAGQAHEIHKAEDRRQQEAAERQAKYQYYRVPIEAGVTTEGVQVDAHNTYIRIVTQ